MSLCIEDLLSELMIHLIDESERCNYECQEFNAEPWAVQMMARPDLVRLICSLASAQSMLMIEHHLLHLKDSLPGLETQMQSLNTLLEKNCERHQTV